MSLQIIKPGISDTIQDQGRHGHQHLGINPGGAMDRFSAQLANALLGKNLNSAVIEIHFPSLVIEFSRETIICIAGADFSPTINHKRIPINQPVAVNKQSILQFETRLSGARCYLACLHDLDINEWLNSYSTNLAANAGGFNGRALKKGDILNFKNNFDYKYLQDEKDFTRLPWKAVEANRVDQDIRFVKGNEWDWLTYGSLTKIQESSYEILNNSNRMGYRLKGNSLKTTEERQLISSAVTFGTIQLLPDGQLIVLMADHQTTGGYPRVGHIISADLPLLAQRNPGDQIKFSLVDNAMAERELIEQYRHLLQLQTASKFKIEKYLNATL